MEDIRAEKAERFKELASDKKSAEYQQWFLRYNPAEKSKIKTQRAMPEFHRKRRTVKVRPSKSNYLF